MRNESLAKRARLQLRRLEQAEKLVELAIRSGSVTYVAGDVLPAVRVLLKRALSLQKFHAESYE